uniref:Inter-alpha-trypsin inhibitor heavy chain H3 n=1 Tax=Astyanax mexicanus TaxID=7994 RepID=A0A8B9K886_ASTMX
HSMWQYVDEHCLVEILPPVAGLKLIEVQSVKIDCKVASRFAHTVMTSTALNKANVSQEVFFEVELPKTAFITNFSMEIDGQTYVGEIKEKEKAKEQYEKAVSSGQTAGLVKASGRKMEKFAVSVNIAANSGVTFTLTYEELLQRRFGKYEIMIRVKPKQLVQHFEIVADIYEPQGIAFLNTNATFLTNELIPLVKETITDKMAHMSFSPTLEQQRKCPDCDGTLIDGDFIITYDVNRAEDIGDIVNGYFVHFFAPADLPRLSKNVVFVIDRSGSMHGKKMEQTQEALATILDDLYQEDYFGLVTFDNTVEFWRQSLSQASEENIKEAKKFVETIKARHMTDINEGVLQAVDMLTTAKKNSSLPDNSASMIILLTDGEPTSGEQNVSMIQENVRNAIGGNMSLFCLGFGYDLDYAFLDVLAKQNEGLARRIYEASDAVLQLQGFYEEVASPLLLEVNLHYPGSVVNSLTNSHFRQLFNGTEIVVAGQLNELEVDNFLVEEWALMFPEQEYIFGDFTERLWAYLTIQQLLDKRSALHLMVDGDPHFIIEIPNLNDALCFNTDDQPGTIFNLVRDPLTGFVVNGQTIGDKKVEPGSKGHTYFGRFGIVHETFDIRLTVTTQEILVSEQGKHEELLWSKTSTVKGINMELHVSKDRSLTVTLKNSVKFVIILHKVWKKHPYHQDYLGFYTLDSHLLSQSVHGLIGQFFHGIKFEVSDLFQGKDPEKPDATMSVKGNRLTVTRGWQRDFRKDVKNGETVPCWFIHNNGTGLIDGDLRDYVVSELFKSI